MAWFRRRERRVGGEPADFEGREVPGVLLSGHHQEIEKWRLESSVMRTLLKRPDLLQKKDLNRRERDILEKWRREIEKILEHSR